MTISEKDDHPIWSPSNERIASASVTKFLKEVNTSQKLTIPNIHELYKWTIVEPEIFWSTAWDFMGVVGRKGGGPFLSDKDRFLEAKWFPNSSLNFAQNLLRHNNDTPALIFYGEDKEYQKISKAMLFKEVLRLQRFFISLQVKPGDVIAGLVPNMPIAVIGMLAASSLGAIWTSCSPDFGASGIIDRFGQTAPKILVTADGYFYKGSIFPLQDKVNEVLASIPSIEHVLFAKYTGTPFHISKKPYSAYETLPSPGKDVSMHFEMLPFSHPLYIMYSSGTTGKPKCIVHGAGGTLLEHMKEHVLHLDFKSSDTIIYQSTCGWMMWNWLVSALAVGATVVLYDGYPLLNNSKIFFDIIDREKITVFGTNAKYISALEKEEISPHTTHDLSSLHTILSTGSPLLPESFDYIYSKVKKNLCLSSISGGTDIIGCFALGSPTLPVYRGELQTRSLGLNVQVWSDTGESLYEQRGELVCTAPFPSQPVGFWNDADKKRYRAAYFERFPNIWCHGDYVELTKHNGMIFFGRSDTVLNPGGIRIGTAEIYRQVEKLSEVEESVVVGQDFEGDVRIALFVKLRPNIILNEKLIQKIRDTIRANASPFHVPKIISQVPDIPKTRSGKISEAAVRDIVNGRELKNTEALVNPESLAYFKLS